MLLYDGKERFVIPDKDFHASREQLEDEADYRPLLKARKANAGKPLIPQEQIMREFGLTPRKAKRKSN